MNELKSEKMQLEQNMQQLMTHGFAGGADAVSVANNDLIRFNNELNHVFT